MASTTPPGEAESDRQRVAERASRYGVSIAVEGPVADAFVIDIRSDPLKAAPTLFRAVVSADGLRDLKAQISSALDRHGRG
jgi:hypothetical protein